MDRDYLGKKLNEAEAELDAARTRTALYEAAVRYQRAKAELRALEQAAKASKRRASRASRSAGAPTERGAPPRQ